VRTREDFCDEVGLPADRPFVAFLGSSPFIAPNGIEVEFVRRWVQALRAAESPVRDVGVLVRPHPQNGEPWRDADLSGLGDIAVWPRAGADPVDATSRSDFHDSLEYCAAVVGINTSALIESAVVGRPVLTILAQEFKDTQEGTIHFEHLRRAGGGVLLEASGFEENIAQLASALKGEDGFAERNRNFLQAFVRPHGLQRPAAPIVADALEDAAARGPRPVRGSALAEAPARLAWKVLRSALRVRAAGRGNATKAADKAARGERKTRKAQGLPPTEVRR
jgi:hypothetical protein